MILRLSLCILGLCSLSLASYCGHAAIPFTFQNLQSGHPVLGCARPRCFGWTNNGTRASDSAQFYRINGKEDGYLRRSDLLLKAPAASTYLPQTSTCSEQHSTDGCAEGQWVGGIAPMTNSYHRQLQVRCCSYAPLLNTEDRGVAPIKQGEVFIGGEVLEGSKLIAFDYISDIKKELLDDGTIQYSVAVRRMQCTDEVDIEIEAVVSRNAKVKPRDGEARRPEVRQKSASPTDHQLQNLAQGVATHIENVPINTGFGQALQSNMIESEAAVAGRQQGLAHNQQAGLQPLAGAYQGAPLPPSTPQGLPVVQQGVPIAAPGQYNYAPQTGNYQQPNGYGQQQTGNVYQPQQVENGQQYGQQQQQYYGNQYQQGYGNQYQQQQGYVNQNTQQQQYGQMQQQVAQTVAPAATQMPDGNKMLGEMLPLALMNGQPLPTLPPFNLEQLPKLDIPSVEDVENVIPPLQKSILTNIAKIFGVL